MHAEKKIIIMDKFIILNTAMNEVVLIMMWCDVMNEWGHGWPEMTTYVLSLLDKYLSKWKLYEMWAEYQNKI